MKNNFTWTIGDIEKITENEAEKLTEERETIKGHNIYFVDFHGYFGYSCLVFYNQYHIYYANDYQLHHHEMSKEELKQFYRKKLNSILFTETEISLPLKNYEEYKRREDYLRNYYGMQEDYISAFGIFKTEKDIQENEKKTEKMIYDPISFAYYHNKEFVEHHIKLYEQLLKVKKLMQNDFDYIKNAFVTEMFNHEYGYSSEGNYDVLSAFGDITYNQYDDYEEYFKELHFSDLQQKAYVAAIKEYNSKI